MSLDGLRPSEESPSLEIQFINEERSLDLEKLEIDTHVTERSRAYMILLTMGLGGLQGVFAIQFGNGSLFLASLGLNNSLMSLVWLSGPIAGAALQPIFGACSDRCLSSWGRRRPYVATGALFTIFSMLGLSYSQELALFSRKLVGASQHGLTLGFAIVSIFALNIAIQPLQGALRALIVDSCPASQQNIANAWAGRTVGIANIFSYLCSFVDLQDLLPGLRQSQFQLLCMITIMILAITICVTCSAIKEVPLKCRLPTAKSIGIGAKIHSFKTSFSIMPNRVQHVLAIQFFSWIGWFQFLYYITTYLGHTSKNSTWRLSPVAHGKSAPFGMLLFSVTSLLAGVILPMLTNSSISNTKACHRGADRSQLKWFFVLKPLDITWVWMISQILFAVCMMSTLFLTSLFGSLMIMAIMGISWGVTAWAPFAIISTEIVKQASEDQPDMELRPGIVLGLHNVAISVPQILAGIEGSIVYWAFQNGSFEVDHDGTAWVLALAGLSALYSAYLIVCLRKGENQL